MRGRKLKLGLPEVAAVIDERHAKERDARNKNRLLAVKLAARGHLFRWLKTVRKEGLDGLLMRGKPGPKEGACRGLSPSVAAELAGKLAAGDFVSAVAAMRWLQEAHGLERPYQSVWRWLKKAGGVLLVPRPSHSKKDPAAAERFRSGLAEKLESLELPAGSRVKLWMMDESRFGLHTELCRLWACNGQRPVVTRQIKYQWDYLYGSLDVISGQAHFFQIPSVNQGWGALYLKDLETTDPMPSTSSFATRPGSTFAMATPGCLRG
ncbi:MAG: winged helix-turn-helix domain-containing protein [Chthoniobacterales bacterium]